MNDINKSMRGIAERVVRELDALLKKYGQQLRTEESSALEDTVYEMAIQKAAEGNMQFAARLRNSSMRVYADRPITETQNRLDQTLEGVAKRCKIPIPDLTSMKTNMADSIAGAVDEALKTLGFTWRDHKRGSGQSGGTGINF